VKCLTTINADNSVDLQWTNPANAVKNQIWYYSYASLPDATGYPEYGPASDYTIPDPPLPTGISPNQDGWIRAVTIDAAASYTHTGMDRGYYYYVIFAETATGSFSPAPEPTGGLPFYRESISYWPGDVAGVPNGTDSVVNFSDIVLLSTAWGTQDGDEGWNNIIDVGPTEGNLRRGRPLPDNVINLQDLMIFSNNYENTDYEYYPTNIQYFQEPVEIELITEQTDGLMIAYLLLYTSNVQVKGLEINLNPGSGLVQEEITAGDIWPETSFFRFDNADNSLIITGAALGADNCLAAEGTIAVLTFQVSGEDYSLELGDMTARDIFNLELEITNNNTGNDSNNIIPLVNSLGNNYPNPFNPTTTIVFGLKEEAEVSLMIYNIKGQKVKTLVNELMPAGQHEVVWNGKDDNEKTAASGIYFYKMQTSDYLNVRKAVLLK